MYRIYAADLQARINLGIRRRLAPLMENDPERIKLMNSLLLSMPGSPIVYYGDEIGMGDNIYLGDRNGVRTPMQWSPDRNAGFSRADPQRLYLPPIMDPIYGFEAVNVEAQQRDPSSLLNWMKRMLATRKASKAFGRGRLAFLRPATARCCAYLREYEDEAILCVANLSRTAQPVELDLKRFKGRVPVEMLGRTSFPPIGELPYLPDAAGARLLLVPPRHRRAGAGMAQGHAGAGRGADAGAVRQLDQLLPRPGGALAHRHGGADAHAARGERAAALHRACSAGTRRRASRSPRRRSPTMRSGTWAVSAGC